MDIISIIAGLLKDTKSLIEFEEQLKLLMQKAFTQWVGEIFEELDKTIKQEKLEEGWVYCRSDNRNIQFLFGSVTFKRSLMHDKRGNSHYPLDEWLGLVPHQRYSPLVELKVAELASENTYREVADILKEWTAVSLSHTTVGNMVKHVGKTQAEADKALVEELEIAVSLPEGKKVDYLFSEADGVFVRGLKKKQSMEVHHAILYEGWETNGKRVSLRQPTVIMTTEDIQTFWDEVQATAANTYSLEKTHVITNSDGGAGYTAERFQTAFSQSEFPVLNQLDTYHVAQAIIRTFGGGKSEIKEQIRKAIRTHDLDQFTLYLDTHESTLTDKKALKKIKEFRSYILKNWDRIFDWRDRVKNVPEGARGLGAMESNQRHISFRMKKRGMHWSELGAEAMVKIKQGILNGTLREAYLKHRSRSERKQRNLKQSIRMSQLLKQPVRPSVGVKHGSVALHSSSSSAMGHLSKILELSF
ncbi:ISLre2-like element ISBco6 family transposase [Weizmannia coagulans]|uniref:ISLre2-like element ISBco6 family transposase n=1 Tax=Heyndrickxia coagulans TaxID=1398 RepID=A0AAN0T8D8_HEYCO|nr:ISLre2-like element ISBco6 family transposase [Heyndrickxia coagulans]AJO24408.1 hypothetical protein SB48_HM08orf05750 [Heyndrickxia coagulans]MDL4843903.1 ISLre2-like element ISBco6 family transposase [Heyndrickxia coagulans]MDL4845644.1 ISLre2-like element ISBco6 family transposase [Heyndrickxia coagulans]MDL5040403.1 ISLre2-like element ISBco6 family transposase [Heyndrickxia coagulans]MDL5042419.1 ISLre2-like element ISBco6 family transposase [Heyndrickxia coagulans]